MYMFKIFKILILFLLIISVEIQAQTTTDGIVLKSPGRIIGQNGDTLYNSGPGTWTFSNDTLKGVIFPGLETMAMANNTYWVSPSFPNSGKYWNSIQGAINAAPNPTSDSNQVTILVLPGNYNGFNCNKSYINIIGMGNAIVDSSISTTKQCQISGHNVKIDHIKFSNKRVPTITESSFSIIYLATQAGLTIENSSISYINQLYDYYDVADVNVNGIDGSNSDLSDLVITNCDIDLTFNFIPTSTPFDFISVNFNGVTGYRGGSDAHLNRVIVNGLKVYIDVAATGWYYFDINGINIIMYDPIDGYFWRTRIKNTEIYIRTAGLINPPAQIFSIQAISSIIVSEFIGNYLLDIDTSTGTYLYNILIDPKFKIKL